MAQVPIREGDAKAALYERLADADELILASGREVAAVEPETDLDDLLERNPWLAGSRLVVKVDQVVKRRGVHGLVALDLGWNEARRWIEARLGERFAVDGLEGRLERFIVERFVAHAPEDERYVCLRMTRAGDELLLLDRGGADVGDVDGTARRVLLDLDEPAAAAARAARHLHPRSTKQTSIAARFLAALAVAAADLHLSYVEVNPLLLTDDGVRLLDLAVRIDDTAPQLVCMPAAAFGADPTDAELRVRELDARTGASLKLTVLDPRARIWLLVAGGGASVAYADTVHDLGGGSELANYGEYSGDPTETLTYEYARVILELMTEGEPTGFGKVLLLGGAIANFTDVAATFAGVARALREFAPALRAHDVRIYIRRGGPNADAGLSLMRDVCQELGLPAVVRGIESTLTTIVALALDELELTPRGTGALA